MIAITGYGIVCALGAGKDACAKALREGRSGIAPLRLLDTCHKDFPAGEVPLTNAELAARYYAGDPYAKLDDDNQPSRTAMLAHLAMKEAYLQARNGDTDGCVATAVISGTTVGTMDRTERREHTAGDCGECTRDALAAPITPFFATVSTACSSAANAFILGAELLRTGKFKYVVVGGTESLSRFHFNGFRSLMILDQEACRPFDETRAGLNLGEGAAYFVMETEESAVGRGAKILAYLAGWGNRCDAYHQTASSPDGDGAFLAMQDALRRAHLAPQDIDYINAHGTGTPNNDPSELAAMRRLFGEKLPPVSSTKGLTGHTTSASGAIEAAFCLMAMDGGFLPVNAGCTRPLAPEIVCRAAKKSLRHVLCNAFGFGGNDTALLFAHPGTHTPPPAPKSASYGGSWHFTPESLRPVYLAAAAVSTAVSPDRLPKIPPLVARRLSPMLKTALQTSRYLLAEVGDPQPDAIITATAHGCLSQTMQFLREIDTQHEQLLHPAAFMQSTHNTVGSLIAIQTRNHGYNTTYSNGPRSLQCALIDAVLQIGLGELHTALVGLHDEQPVPQAFSRSPYDEPSVPRSVVCYLTDTPTPAAVPLDIDKLFAAQDDTALLASLNL